MAKLIKQRFPGVSSIADVAAGKGYMQVALREQGYSNITSFDKQKKHCRGGKFEFQYRYFNQDIKNQTFDLIVGMHPDEATDHIIIEAAKRGIPFVVCPCCVTPSAVAYWGQYKFNLWVAHLKKLATDRDFIVEERYLKMRGRNLVLIGAPKSLTKNKMCPLPKRPPKNRPQNMLYY